MKKCALSLAAMTAAVMFVGAGAEPVEAKQLWSNTNIGYHYWDKSAGKTNDYYLELEHASGYDWGQIYGFIDFTNPGNGNDSDGRHESRLIKINGHYYLGDSDFSLFGQYVNFRSDFVKSDDQDFLLGFGYTGLKGDWGFFTPSVTAVYSHYSGTNRLGGKSKINEHTGYQIQASYRYNVLPENKLFIAGWHENQYITSKKFAQNTYGSVANNLGKKGDWAMNGAAGLWTDLSAWGGTNTPLTVGVEWRYAEKKLGNYHSTEGVKFVGKLFF